MPPFSWSWYSFLSGNISMLAFIWILYKYEEYRKEAEKRRRAGIWRGF